MDALARHVALPALAGALLAPSPLPEELVYDPADGARLERRFSLETVSRVDEAVHVVGGDEHEFGVGSTRTTRLDLEVVDAIESADGGRPTRLVRSIEGGERSSEVEGFEVEHEEGRRVELGDAGPVANELDGLAVEFTWSPDEERYVVAWAEDAEGDDDWLDDLDEDMDLRALLPDGDVEVGDAWDVPASLVDDLLAPGGRLFREPAEDGGVPEGGIAIVLPDTGAVGRWGELDGDVTARLVGTREEDGARVAVLAVEFDLDGEREVGDLLNESSVEAGLPEVDYLASSLERTLDGEATVLWDLDAGHVRSFELDAEFTARSELEWELDLGGSAFPLEVSEVRGGTLRASYEVE